MFTSKKKVSRKTTDMMPLEASLKVLEKKYNATFIYKSSLVEGKTVPQKVVKAKDFQTAFGELLNYTDLTYDQIGNRSFLLSAAPVQLSHAIVQETVSGTVTDAQTGDALPGVNILVVGTSTGAATDAKGHYSLQVESLQDSLRFSYIGYQTKTVAIKGRTTIDIALEPQVFSGEQMVVVGYGTKKRKNLTGAVSTIQAKSIESQSSMTNSEQALQGVKGLYVQQTSGQPGAEGIDIHIRGIGTLNSTNPLVLINGIEGSLSDINPDNIKSISVLKDAASTAIYGSRAANGVILVTTKTGHEGQTQVDYSYDFGMQQATTLPDMVTNSVKYMKARNMASVNESLPKPYSQEEINEFKNNPDPFKNPNSNFINYMYGKAPTQTHNLNISGGSDKVNYRVSLRYLNQKGIIKGKNSAKKYFSHVNVNADITKKLTVGGDLGFVKRKRIEPGDGISRVINYSFKALPIQPIKLENGKYAVSWVKTPHAVSPVNAAAMATDPGFNNRKDFNTRGVFFANYVLPANVELNLKFGFKKTQKIEDVFVPQTFLYNPLEPDVPLVEKHSPAIQEARYDGSSHLNTTFISTIKWNRSIKHNNIKVLGGFSSLSFVDRVHGATSQDFKGNGIQVLSGGSTPTRASGSIDESRLLSAFGRLDYDFKEKYLLQFNMRYDGSSKFAEHHRWGLFPSFSAGWRLSNEPFFKNVSAISNLKLKGSWGKVGNNSIGNFAYLSKINTGGIYSFNNNIVGTAAINTLTDPKISWETTTKVDVGLNIGLWNSLDLNIDYFHDKTKDILTRVTIPQQVGDLGGPLTNLYAMTNKGMEFSVDYTHQIGSVNINFGGQLTLVKNNVDFINGNTQYKSNLFGDIQVIEEGYPVNSFLLYKAIGLFQSEEEVKNHAYQGPNYGPGDIMYADVSSDGQITSDDRIVTSRSSLPQKTYSFNLGINYKDISLNMYFQWVQGIHAYPVQNISLPLYNGAGITKYQLKNSWTENNRDASLPRLTVVKHADQRNFKNSTLWLQNASYLRLKSIKIGYELPKKLIKGFFLNDITIYISGRNLFTITPFPNYGDPENVTGEGSLYVYPMLKSYHIGINVKF
jgi:TonB-linked SusC/RagA family outer membrane protein